MHELCEWPNFTLAIVNGGGVRASLSKGSLHSSCIYDCNRTSVLSQYFIISTNCFQINNPFVV